MAGSGSSTGAAAASGGPSVFQWKGESVEIRNVWAGNLEEEMAAIRELVPKYPFVAMDTEFPGVVARPVGAFSSHTEYTYQTLRCNVDMLRLIQLGLTFADASGNVPEGVPTWQFNFQFSLVDDMFAEDSIALLKRSGLDFPRHASAGIPVAHFAELLMASGLVLMKDVKWLTFHSGFDFGYLLKLLTAAPLPADEAGFFRLLHTYFPAVYDVKQMCTAVSQLSGGLNRVAEALAVPRAGPAHQAGSDSLVTSAVFFALQAGHMPPPVDDKKYRGVLYGMGGKGNGAPAPAPAAARPRGRGRGGRSRRSGR